MGWQANPGRSGMRRTLIEPPLPRPNTVLKLREARVPGRQRAGEDDGSLSPAGGTAVDQGLRKSSPTKTQLPKTGSDTELEPALRTVTPTRVKWDVYSTSSTRRMGAPDRADTGATKRLSPDSLP
jgi:hypothetical protein